MISAKVVADSISEKGKRITTFELNYPRMIHCEYLVHKMLAKNSSSSRAIPIKKQISAIWNNFARPIFWGKNCAGMGAKEELTGWRLNLSKLIWELTGRAVLVSTYFLAKLGGAKEWVNRMAEPWSYIKVVSTATEWNNFFHLRRHSAAQPEIQELANKMWEARQNSVPRLLLKGQWHLPYVMPEIEAEIGLESSLKLSASLCAQTSYRTANDTLEAAERIFNRLVTSDVVHASPTEHQATPSDDPNEISGNLRGWFQYRQMIPNNVCLNYKESA